LENQSKQINKPIKIENEKTKRKPPRGILFVNGKKLKRKNSDRESNHGAPSISHPDIVSHCRSRRGTPASL
jgi:hypothetical protein